MMMKAPMSMLAAGLLLLAGQGKGQAQTYAPLANSSLGTVSNLKFTGEAQTDEVRWGRGYYRGYGFYRPYYGYRYRPNYYGYGYGYRPYYSSYSYCNPYSYGYAYRPYNNYGNYGYRPYVYGNRGYYGGYRRIDMAQTPPPATKLGTVAQKSKASGPIQLTQFVPAYQNTPVNQGNQSYPYDGGPKSVVPLPNGLHDPVIPAPSIDTERPTLPRDGVPVSAPRGISGEVFPVVYDVHNPVAAPVSAGSGFAATISKISYPAYGDNR
jgi:hypothetical protein